LEEPYRWHFSARSDAATECVAFAASVLRHYAEANRSFGCELTTRVGQMMLQRLQATREKLIAFMRNQRRLKYQVRPALDLLERGGIPT
jgi:hypothetical protein